ncbi:complement C1s subcomponent [Hyla sarda]|uniref:complement C1s subcomponent n=1 Tax=Hyla sarda TaxID=327740 RepID=UPI0024C3E160|nr:complement C1s subcomponent [Hyla sarda]
MKLRWLFLALLGYASAGSPSMFGEVTSPNYPQVYPSSALETWNIQVPDGYGIRLYFIHLDIEPSENCEYDSLQVIIGNEVQQVFCGRHSFGSSGFPKEKFYPTTRMKLSFRSDFSNQERHTGFAAYYVAEDVDECDTANPCSHFCNNYIGGFFCSCPPEYELQEDQNTCGVNCSGGLYTDLRGQISSPGYPSPYPENSRCGYKVVLEWGYQVILTFKAQDFDIEAPEDGKCIYDSLIIKAKGKKFGPYCGKTPPPRIETGSNEVDIDFITDSGGDNKGWNIYYSEYAIPCPTDVFKNSILNPRKDKYFFKDVITVKCKEGYETVLNQKRLPSFRTKCQGDGTWSPIHKCEPVNCGDPDEIDNGEVDFTDSTYGSKAVYKCRTEYYTLIGDDTFHCSGEGLWINSNNKSELPKCIGVCGKTSLSQKGRIFGGEKAKKGYFPWLVRIVMTSNFGGGSLISDGWVVTAAHVLPEGEMPTLQVGDVDYRHAKTIQAKKVIIHPDWPNADDEDERKNYNNDIALIQLAKRIELDECISPICLPEKGDTSRPAVREVGYIAGWGKAKPNKTKVLVNEPKILQYTGVPLHDLEKCKTDKAKAYTFTSNMLCAGGDGHDSCQGDSGGPLMYEDRKNNDYKRFYIAGIVSWGIKCGEMGMYTKVRNYVDWIEKTIEEVENEEKKEEQPEPVKVCKNV